MHCRNCGKGVDAQAVVCPSCGVPPLLEKNFCQNCGNATQPNQAICTSCGVSLSQKTTASGNKSKIAAGLLAIFLGSLGIHKFYLGYSKEGAIMLVASLVGACLTFGVATLVVEVIAFIEGIVYLTKSDEDFDRLYVQGHKGWF
jgi:TM2 domain-containing membrane protein YozV/RNA polymerase subunit RPABC4/transcription elongation factor Spt4